MIERVGFIGLGAMGAPMATRLIRNRFGVIVHNRTRNKEVPLAALGAERAATPAEAAKGVEAVVTMVTDSDGVEEVLFGHEGVMAGAGPGTLVIDTSTIHPDSTRRFGEMLAASGIRMIDAPVSGGTEGAKSGTLSIMAGGDTDDFDEALPIFEALGSNVVHVGPLGSGQMTKAVNQVIVAGNFLAVAEGIALGMKSGLDMKEALEAIRAGAAGSWALENRSQRMIEGEFPLGFKVRLHRKDLRIALDVAQEKGLRLPLSELVANLEDSLIEMGFADQDMSSLIKAVLKEL